MVLHFRFKLLYIFFHCLFKQRQQFSNQCIVIVNIFTYTIWNNTTTTLLFVLINTPSKLFWNRNKLYNEVKRLRDVCEVRNHLRSRSSWNFGDKVFYLVNLLPHLFRKIERAATTSGIIVITYYTQCPYCIVENPFVSFVGILYSIPNLLKYLCRTTVDEYTSTCPRTFWHATMHYACSYASSLEIRIIDGNV